MQFDTEIYEKLRKESVQIVENKSVNFAKSCKNSVNEFHLRNSI